METQALSEDLVDGAGDAAEFVFKDRTKRGRIYRMTAAGHLPHRKIGARIFYLKSDLTRAFGALA
jgi:DNA-binding transcriptional regulator PaaX